MANDTWVNRSQGDRIYALLLQLGSELKPVDDEHYYFFEVVRELVDAALRTYRDMVRGYEEDNYSLVAWGCRNLLELSIFMRYVLLSAGNAKRFADDRLIDGIELLSALRELEIHLEPQCSTTALDETIDRFKVQAFAEGVEAGRHLKISDLAKKVGDEVTFRTMNKVSSKLVHPSAWSVLATNPGANAFPSSKELLLGTGAAELSKLYLAVRDFNLKRGMLPYPDYEVDAEGGSQLD